ncbi:MAG: hypothetical protein R2939_16820 [Kofleriaceae bacterium]
MRACLVVAALAAACGAAPLSGGPSGHLVGAMPETLAVDDPITTEPRAARVRVWVAPEVRAEARWREHLVEELDTAGQVLTPLLGIRLELDDVREWAPGIGVDVGAGIIDLQRRDPGDDVAWVIGVVAPPTTTATTMVDLVAAEPLTRHVVIRGYPADAEAAELAARHPGLDVDQERELLAARRRHKQAVALLHGLGRTLAAIDVRAPQRIEHARYDLAQVGFASRNRELMQLAIRDRLAGVDADRAGLAAALLADIEAKPFGGWDEGDRDERVRLLRGVVAAAAATATAEAVPAAAVAQYERARRWRRAAPATRPRPSWRRSSPPTRRAPRCACSPASSRSPRRGPPRSRPSRARARWRWRRPIRRCTCSAPRRGPPPATSRAPTPRSPWPPTSSRSARRRRRRARGSSCSRSIATSAR